MIHKHFLPIVLALSLGIIAFRLSFGLSLFGDDWLVLYIFKFQVQDGNFNSIPLDLVSYLSPYGPTYLLMGIIDMIFGFNPVPYFAISLIFRSLATIALYALVFVLTKNRLSAFAASAFWAISAIGIESTNWVFNMNSYLGLAFFLATTILVLKYHETSKHLFLIISIPLFLLSAISVPVRIHGAFIVLFSIEMFYLLSKWQGLKSLGKFVLINLVWLASFIILTNWGVFGTGSGNFDTYIGKGLKENSAAIEKGNYDHFILPFTTIGGMLFTDQYMNGVSIPRIIYKSQNLSWMRSFLIPLWIVFSLVLITLGYVLVEPKRRKVFILLSSGLMLALILIINVFVRGNSSFLSPNQIFLALVGAAFLIVATLPILITKSANTKAGLFLGISWLLGFAAVPIVFTPLAAIPASMRYLVISGVGIPIIIGVLLSYTKSTFQKLALLILVLPFYLIQYSSIQTYFKNLLISRSEQVSQKVWENILSKIPPMDPQQDYLFYFEPKSGNDSVVRDVITFGFIPRMIVYGESPNRPGSLYVIENRDQFVSAIKDGEKLKGFNWGIAKKIDLRNSFAFRLEPNNTLTDIKSEILYGTR